MKDSLAHYGVKGMKWDESKKKKETWQDRYGQRIRDGRNNPDDKPTMADRWVYKQQAPIRQKQAEAELRQKRINDEMLRRKKAQDDYNERIRRQNEHMQKLAKEEKQNREMALTPQQKEKWSKYTEYAKYQKYNKPVAPLTPKEKDKWEKYNLIAKRRQIKEAKSWRRKLELWMQLRKDEKAYNERRNPKTANTR